MAVPIGGGDDGVAVLAGRGDRVVSPSLSLSSESVLEVVASLIMRVPGWSEWA